MTDTAKSIGKYHIVEELGRGGFATVYKALDTGMGLNREVALKVLHPHLASDPGFISRFQREAQVTAKLFHPHIAMLLEAGEIEGRYYLAMQYISGRNLRDLVRDQGLLPLDTIAAIVEQMGAALDFAHGRGVIHRDVKPGNIIVDDDLHATLTDFGIVKALEGTTLYTTSGGVWGTPSYVSPEQATSGVLDGRSDLYSLAVVAYELCTGQVPFVADTTPSLYYKIVHEAPPASSLVHPRATGPLQTVLSKALAKSPEQRYANGRELADALRAAVQVVQHETIQQLVAQAKTSLAQADFDGAETNLKQALAIRADDPAAQEALSQVATRREVNQRYQALAQTVAQARADAAALTQRDPHLPDPEGVLALFAQGNAVAPGLPAPGQVDSPVQPGDEWDWPRRPGLPAPGQVEPPRPTTWAQRYAGAEMATRLIGGFLLVLGIYLAIASSPYPLPDSEKMNALRLGHLLWGFGLGGVVVAVAVLIAMSRDEQKISRVAPNIVLAVGLLVFLIGVRIGAVTVITTIPEAAATAMIVRDGMLVVGIGVGLATAGYILMRWLGEQPTAERPPT